MSITLKRGANKSVIKRSLKKVLKADSLKGIDAYKYCGIIQLKKDPIDIQKELRDEWD